MKNFFKKINKEKKSDRLRITSLIGCEILCLYYRPEYVKQLVVDVSFRLRDDLQKILIFWSHGAPGGVWNKFGESYFDKNALEKFFRETVLRSMVSFSEKFLEQWVVANDETS